MGKRQSNNLDKESSLILLLLIKIMKWYISLKLRI